MPSHSHFFKEPSPYSAIQAAWPTWHVHEWVWHGINPESREDLCEFKRQLLTECQELVWLSDLTDASKHCGLNRAVKVEKVAGTGRQVKGNSLGALRATALC
jgi:hypothetical protein